MFLNFFCFSLFWIFLAPCFMLSNSLELETPSLANILETKSVNKATKQFSYSNFLIESNDQQINLEHSSFRVNFKKEIVALKTSKEDLDWSWSLHSINGQSFNSKLSPPTFDDSGYVVYQHQLFTERYKLKANSIEQQFILHQKPETKDSVFSIAGEVSSSGKLLKTKDGWEWKGKKETITFGDVYVFDALGKEIPARMEVSSNKTEIFVDGQALSEASYPVTIDPEVGVQDFRISQVGADGDANFDAIRPTLAYNSADNTYLVIWIGETATNGEQEVYGQFIDAITGAEIGVDFRISNVGTDGDANFDATHAALAYNSSANEFLVVWSGDDSVNGEEEIYGQRLNASTGAKLGIDGFRISTMGPNGSGSFDALEPDIAYNPAADEYMVVWRANDNTPPLTSGEFEIFGQRLDASDGSEIGSDDFRISDMGPDGNGNFDAIQPAIAFNSEDGEYLVVWSGDDSLNGEDEIFGQLINATSGAEIGADFRISDMGPDGNGNFDAVQPDVSFGDAQGEYLVVWQGDDTVNGDDDIYGQFVEASTGTELGLNDFQISDVGVSGSATFDAFTPATSYNFLKDEFIVVWQADDSLNGEDEIYLQRIEASSRLEVGIDDLRISNMGPDLNAAFDAFDANSACNPVSGSCLIVWRGDDNTPPLVDGEEEIFGQLFSISPILKSISSTTADGTYGPTAAINITATYDELLDSSSILLLELDNGAIVLLSDISAVSPTVSGTYFVGFTGSGQDSPDLSASNILAENASDLLLAATTDSSIPIAPNNIADTSELIIDTTAPLLAEVSPVATPGFSEPKDYTFSSSEPGEINFSGPCMSDSSSALSGSNTVSLDSDGAGSPLGIGVYNCSLEVADFLDGGISNISSPLAISSFEIITTPEPTGDTDGDGIDDDVECPLGPPFNAMLCPDSDADGIIDPFDTSVALPETFFAGWNGFFNHINILVLRNTSVMPTEVNVSLLDENGLTLSQSLIGLAANSELNLILNDLNGFLNDSIGVVRVDTGSAGVVSGHTALYRLSPGSSNIEYTIIKELEPAVTGSSSAIFNTFQPSRATDEVAFDVPNWLELINWHQSANASFTINKFSQQGALLASETILIPPRGRRDLEAGHVIPGPDFVGLIEVVPNNPNRPYSGRLVRYGLNSFSLDSAGAFSFAQSNALRSGFSEKQTLAISNNQPNENWVELANLSDVPGTVSVKIVNNSGTQMFDQTVSLQAKEQLHLLIGAGLIVGAEEAGIMILEPESGSSFLANSSNYIQNSLGKVQSTYSSASQAPIGGRACTSFNTFLQQKNTIRLFNFSDSSANAMIVAYDSTGSNLASSPISLQSLRGIESDLGSLGISIANDTVGTLCLLSSNYNSIAAEVLRTKEAGDSLLNEVAAALPFR